MLDRPEISRSSTAASPGPQPDGDATDLLAMLLNASAATPEPAPLVVRPAPARQPRRAPQPGPQTETLMALLVRAPAGSQRHDYLQHALGAAQALDEAQYRLDAIEQRLLGYQPGDPEPFGRLVKAASQRLGTARRDLPELRDELQQVIQVETERNRNALERVRSLWGRAYTRRLADIQELEQDALAFAERLQQPLRISEEIAALPPAIADRVETARTHIATLKQHVENMRRTGLSDTALGSSTIILLQFEDELRASSEAIAHPPSPRARKQALCAAWNTLDLAEPSIAALDAQLSDWHTALDAIQSHRSSLQTALEGAERRVRTLDAALDVAGLRAELDQIQATGHALLEAQPAPADRLDATASRLHALANQASAIGVRADALWQDLVAIRTRNQQARNTLERLGESIRELSAAPQLAIAWNTELAAFERLRSHADTISQQNRLSGEQLGTIRRTSEQLDSSLEQLQSWIERIAEARERLLALREELRVLPRLADAQAVGEIQRQALAYDISNWPDEHGLTTLLQERDELPPLEQKLAAVLSQPKLLPARVEPLATRCAALVNTRKAFPARIEQIRRHLEDLRNHERTARVQLERLLPALDSLGRLQHISGLNPNVTRVQRELDQQLEIGHELQSRFVPATVGNVIMNARAVQDWHAAGTSYSAELLRMLVADLQRFRNELQSALAAFQGKQLATEPHIRDARLLEEQLARLDGTLHADAPPQRIAAEITHLSELYARIQPTSQQIRAQAEDFRRETHQLRDLVQAIKQEYGNLQRMAPGENQPWPPLKSGQTVIPRFMQLLDELMQQMERAQSLEALAATRQQSLEMAQTLYKAILEERDQLRAQAYQLSEIEQRFTRLRQKLSEYRRRSDIDRSLAQLIDQRITSIEYVLASIKQDAKSFVEATIRLEGLLSESTAPIYGEGRTLTIVAQGNTFAIE